MTGKPEATDCEAWRGRASLGTSDWLITMSPEPSRAPPTGQELSNF